MIDRLVSRLMINSLRKAFRRICWVGSQPQLDASRPVVVYANHHTFYDGYILWLLSKQMLNRRPMTWMEEWDKFPFFGAVGALPFPADDTQRKLKTIRSTSRRMKSDPNTLLFYFPEAELHAPEEGVRPFSSQDMARLDRILPDKQWLPIAIHMTTRGESLPTLQLYGGRPHDSIEGDEVERLQGCLDTLRSTAHSCSHTLLEGKKGPEEGWDMSFLKSWFQRYI